MKSPPLYTRSLEVVPLWPLQGVPLLKVCSLFVSLCCSEYISSSVLWLSRWWGSSRMACTFLLVWRAANYRDVVLILVVLESENKYEIEVTSKNALQQFQYRRKCISHSHHFIVKSSFRKIILIGWSDLFTWKLRTLTCKKFRQHLENEIKLMQSQILKPEPRM